MRSPAKRKANQTRGELTDLLRHQPLLVLGVGDLKFLNGPMDGFLLVGRVNMPDVGRRAALDPDDPPFMKSLRRPTMVLGGLLCSCDLVISCS